MTPKEVVFMPEIRKLEPLTLPLLNNKRVAAYARVSSAKDAMLHSLSAQVSHYSEYIQNRRGWEFAGVYADEGITGTATGRPGFLRLMDDTRHGKIDIIITKCISRFARNTLTTLEAVRELKAIGVDVYFENESIHTISGDGELMLTILASFAQEESRSVSENCKWRIRKRFADGELVNLRFIYGYKIKKGKIDVDSKQAEIVRMIFDDYIGGMGGMAIAKKLNAMGVAAPGGGRWRENCVRDIIKNEKFAGSALLQKKYVVDHLSKKLVRNKGELTQYYAEGSHPAIVDAATFEAAQSIICERARRFDAKDVSGNRYPFSGKIHCGHCGKNFKRKTTRGDVFWNCAAYLSQGKSVCQAKQIPEDTLLSVTAAVLGVSEFDAELFHAKISEIIVPGANQLVYLFNDGHTVEKAWHDRSRRDSWTDEMRQAARERSAGQRRISM